MNDPLTEAEIVAIRAYCDAATPGPWNEPELWKRCRPENYSVTVSIGEPGDERTLFDTLNRDYRLVTLDTEADESGQVIADHQAHKDLVFAERARMDLPRVLTELEEMKSSFALRWDADMRAIKRWQVASGETLVWPDHADLCVWLLEQQHAQSKLIEQLTDILSFDRPASFKQIVEDARRHMLNSGFPVANEARLCIPPVDRTARTLTDGSPVTDDHREINPATGQQKGYVVLSAEERAKGFVKPVRRSYVHRTCGAVTTMNLALAETYARDPAFYSGTFCCRCKTHFPLNEFVWDGTDEVLGS